MKGESQRPLAHLAGSRRRWVLEGAHRTWLGRRVYRSWGRRRCAIAHRVIRQRLGCPPAGEQRPTKPAAVRLAPLGRRFRVRLEKLFVLLFLAQIEDIIREDAQRRHARTVVRQLVALIEQPLTNGRNVQLLLQLPNTSMKKGGNLGYTKRVTYLKLDVLDRHLFRDPYSSYSSFHRADPFRLSLGFSVPRTICEDGCLAAVYHDWILRIRIWCWVWILAAQDADRNFCQVIIRFPIKGFIQYHAGDQRASHAPLNSTLFAKRRIMNKSRIQGSRISDTLVFYCDEWGCIVTIRDEIRCWPQDTHIITHSFSKTFQSGRRTRQTERSRSPPFRSSAKRP